MIDLKLLRESPALFRDGAAKKGIAVDFDRLLALDEKRRALLTKQENLRAEQKRIEKDLGPQIGKLAGQIKKTEGPERTRLEKELDDLKSKPTALKSSIQALDQELAALEPELSAILLTIPLPPDPDVPIGSTSDDNKEVRRWNPPGFDTTKPFESQRGFAPKSHMQLVKDLGLADFERGVKLAGARSYILTGDGMLLHHAVLRYAFDFMTLKQGFTPVSVPVLVREEAMVGTGFFPAGREQAYHVPGQGGTALQSSGGGTGLPTGVSDLFLTGTGEVGLMGLHMGEILDESRLPLKYTTVSTCFRREAGAAGKDTAGLYRIHQFDKVEQVVICRADQAESRRWHQTMISYVEQILQSLLLPYRLVQCCTGDLGPKNADMIDIESWMPGRSSGPPLPEGGGRGVGSSASASGAYGETHSASRLYDFQCRRLNMRYRSSSDGGKGPTTFCHSLNNTVIASPRILIPLLEMHQQQDGSVTIPEPLRPYLGGKQSIG